MEKTASSFLSFIGSCTVFFVVFCLGGIILQDDKMQHETVVPLANVSFISDGGSIEIFFGRDTLQRLDEIEGSRATLRQAQQPNTQSAWQPAQQSASSSPRYTSQATVRSADRQLPTTNANVSVSSTHAQHNPTWTMSCRRCARQRVFYDAPSLPHGSVVRMQCCRPVLRTVQKVSIVTRQNTSR